LDDKFKAEVREIVFATTQYYVRGSYYASEDY
jgi:hypothetical protein